MTDQLGHAYKYQAQHMFNQAHTYPLVPKASVFTLQMGDTLYGLLFRRFTWHGDVTEAVFLTHWLVCVCVGGAGGGGRPCTQTGQCVHTDSCTVA